MSFLIEHVRRGRVYAPGGSKETPPGVRSGFTGGVRSGVRSMYAVHAVQLSGVRSPVTSPSHTTAYERVYAVV